MRVLILLVAVAGFVSIAYNRARQSIASFKAGEKYDGVRLGPAMYADPTDHPIVIAIGWGLRELIWWWLVTIQVGGTGRASAAASRGTRTEAPGRCPS